MEQFPETFRLRIYAPPDDEQVERAIRALREEWAELEPAPEAEGGGDE